MDSSVKCNSLSKSDFDVFSKVGQHCLERGFITEAFAWSEIGGEDDVLHLQLIEGIDVQVAGQPTAQSTVGVLDAALLPGRIGICASVRSPLMAASATFALKPGV